jgi:hypothetical protein
MTISTYFPRVQVERRWLADISQKYSKSYPLEELPDISTERAIVQRIGLREMSKDNGHVPSTNGLK